MPVELKDVWDMHVDLRSVVTEPVDRPYLKEQMDVATARRMGGIFTTTGRKAGAPREVQFAVFREHLERARSVEGMVFVRKASDVEGTGRQVLHAEGLYFVETEQDLTILDWMWNRHFRSIGPTYNEPNALCGGATTDPAQGVTPLGREFLLEAWRKGFLIDCAHCNHKTMDEMAELALREGKPLVYTHGHLDACWAEKKHGQRGIPRETAKKLLATGGVIGLSPHPGFVGTFERHLREIGWLAEVAPGQVVLGSDFAGTNTQGPDGARQFPQCRGIWGVPAFAEIIAERHGGEFARAYFGGNLKAFLKKSLPQ